jgi:hypothetical protein
MSVVAPPEPPRPDDLEALIREARARQVKRRAGVAGLVALLAGGAIAAYSIASGGNSDTSPPGKPTPAVKTARDCGIRVVGPRILGSDGRTVYREPIRHGVHPNRIPSEVRCSGPTVWVVWSNGVGMMQEAYVGARSVDRGRTWKLVFSEGMFGPKAPHELDSYLGPWLLRGRIAYFVGSCPACSTKTSEGTVSLWVTKDAGRTFREYKVPALTGYAPTGLRVTGKAVTIFAKRFVRGVKPHKTVTVRVA